MTEYSNPGTGRDIPQTVSDTAQQAADRLGEAGEAVRGQVGDEVGRRSTGAGEQVVATGDAMRQAGEQLRGQGNDLPAQLAEQVAAQADRLGRYLRDSDGETILRDVEDFARRQPWLVAGVGFAAGLGVARLLKASRRRPGLAGTPSSAPTSGSYTGVPGPSTEPLAPEPPPAYGTMRPPDPMADPGPPASPGASPFARPAPAPRAEEDPRPPSEGWR